jgi:hypothetical protein
MPSSSTITPPFWRGYILLEMGNGKTYKYVRNVTKNMYGTADSSGQSYYTWGDSIGDTFYRTGDTRGRIMNDFNRVCLLWTLNGATAGKYMFFPEVAGDTATLIRVNKEQLFPNRIAGDTYSYRLYNINVNTMFRTLASQIQSITLIQERIPDWYKNSYSQGNTNRPLGV